MANIPSVVSKRLISTVPKFKKILAKAKEMDVNESDTVTIITDMLNEIFGFDKYSEITREFAIQGTYCDLAIKMESEIEYLIEVKAIGLELNEKHLKQAINYASREGVKWVILTNGITWKVYCVTLQDKVQHEHVFTIDFEDINAKTKETQEQLFLLCKRGIQKDLISEYYEHRQSVNSYTIGALLLTDTITSAIRKELRKLRPGIKVDSSEISNLIKTQVLKRDILESESGAEAKKQVNKFIKKQEREKFKNKKTSQQIETVVDVGSIPMAS